MTEFEKLELIGLFGTLSGALIAAYPDNQHILATHKEFEDRLSALIGYAPEEGDAVKPTIVMA